MAKISELEAKKSFDVIEGKVKSIGETRSVREGQLNVADAVIEDDSGSIGLTLWNDDINKVKTGDKVKITKGWTNEFQGRKSVSAGKFGNMEVTPGQEEKKEEKISDDTKFAVDNDII
ncbi:MAG: DNA-binding protein [Nanobdellota archaeon]